MGLRDRFPVANQADVGWLWHPDVEHVEAAHLLAHVAERKAPRVSDEVEADELHHPIERSGVHRVEVFLGGRPWIYSNPVYVRG